jgi:hypothetical protein
MLDVESAAIDGQLFLYAAILRQFYGIPISRAVMWQFKQSPPKPAKLKQNGEPSVAAQSTTWDMWISTLPAPVRENLRIAEWHTWAQEKLHPLDDFMSIVDSPLNDAADSMTLTNVRLIANRMAMAQHEEQQPAIYSSYGCVYCPFKPLCLNPFRYGTSAEFMLSELYQPRKDLTDL